MSVDRQKCVKCHEVKPVNEYDYYKKNETWHRRKTCQKCIIPRSAPIDETQTKINYIITEIRKNSDNHEVLEQLALRLLQYIKWKSIEAKATDENSIIIKKTPETDILDTCEDSAICDLQKSTYIKLQKEIPLEDIHILTYSHYYMIFIDHPLMKSHLWVLLN
jgi:hypothetical protein